MASLVNESYPNHPKLNGSIEKVISHNNASTK